jgi:CDGSH-type Zn-finger protein
MAHPTKGKPMTDIPHIAQKAPYPVDLEAGKTYFWCACGQSKSQPFCDGSHKGTSFTPMKFTAEDSKTAYLCGCKQTKHAPFCDGTHKSL